MKNLGSSRRSLLKAVNRLDEAETSEIAEQEQVQNHYSSQRSVSNALNDLEQDTGFIQSHGGNPKSWSLTDRGSRKVTQMFEDELEDTQPTNLYNGEEAAAAWTDFFQQEEEEQLVQVEKGRRHVEVDFETLAQFDSSLADSVMKTPDTMIAAAEEAVRERNTIVTRSIEDSVDVRISNVSKIDTQSISEISGSEMGELISVEGVIQSVSDGVLKLHEAVFECQQCMNTLVRRAGSQIEDQVQPPVKCGNCDSEMFQITERKFQDRRTLVIKQKPDKRSREKLRVVLQGELAQDKKRTIKATGSAVRIIGYLEPQRKNERSKKKLYYKRLRANNVELLEDKWEDIDISNEEEKQIQEISDRDDVKDLLVDSFAKDELAHMDLVKESALIWMLGKSDEGNVHVMLIGEPGTGKSKLARYIEENFPKVLGTVGTGASGVGLTATVRRDEVTNDWVAEAGQLPMADEGYHITDEFDKIGGDDAIKINEALSEGTISLSKANINTKMAARVSEYAIGNPEGDIFDPNEMKFRQLPINDNQTSLKDRFDAIIGLQRSSWSTDEQRERERDKVRKILSRGDGDSEFDVGRSDCVSTDLLVKYIAYAQRVSPELTDDVRQEMLDLYESIKDMEGEDQNLWDTRRVVSVKKLSKAYARLELSESVEKRHVHQANEFLRRCLSSIDFEIGMDDFDELGSGDKRLSQEILETVADLESRGDDDLADVQDLIESLDCSEDRAEDVLDDLKSEGEVFNPEKGKVKQL